MRVSLVIPLFNEASSAPALLESVEGQTRPPDEVICVDAGSNDGTAAIVQDFSKRLPLKLIQTKRLFPGEARNTGARQAQYDWLAFADGGTVLDTRWLEALAGAAAGADVVYGSFEPASRHFFEQCAAVAYVPRKEQSGIRGPSVSSVLLKRNAWARAGGFPGLRAAEDLVFFERLTSLGLRSAAAPDASVLWQVPRTAEDTFRRFSLYSFHNLAAKRGWDWHAGLARQYVLLSGAMLALGAMGSSLWPLLLPGLLVARATKAAILKRRSLSFSLSPGHILGAAAVLAITDAATAVGWLRWLLRMPPKET